MSYFLAPSLVRAFSEINGAWPNRSKASDGWIGDTSHQARKSSHNPLWSAPGKWSGVVRAIDVTNDSESMRQAVVKAAVGHPAVWYVISKGVIWSRTYGWAAKPYTGSNPHNGHVHISIRENIAAWDSNAPWLGEVAEQWKVRPIPVNRANVKEQFLRHLGVEKGPVKAINGVARVQKALNAEYNAGLVIDGIVGEATLNAWGRHESTVGVKGRPRVPDKRSLDALAKGRFRTFAPSKDKKPEPDVDDIHYIVATLNLGRAKKGQGWRVKRTMKRTRNELKKKAKRAKAKKVPIFLFLQEIDEGDVTKPSDHALLRKLFPNWHKAHMKKRQPILIWKPAGDIKWPRKHKTMDGVKRYSPGRHVLEITMEAPGEPDVTGKNMHYPAGAKNGSRPADIKKILLRGYRHMRAYHKARTHHIHQKGRHQIDGFDGNNRKFGRLHPQEVQIIKDNPDYLRATPAPGYKVVVHDRGKIKNDVEGFHPCIWGEISFKKVK